MMAEIVAKPVDSISRSQSEKEIDELKGEVQRLKAELLREKESAKKALPGRHDGD